MTFNIKKCHQLSVRKRGHNVVTANTLYGQTLEPVDHHPYLGVELQSDLKWNQHIHQVTAKANRSLGFLRRNIDGPFAASGHMVQNPPCWRASCPLGHPEQREVIKPNLHFLCFGCPSA